MKKNYYSLHADAYDSNGIKHVVTVVGELICSREKKYINWGTEVILDEDKGKSVPGTISFAKNVLYRKLSVGAAICAPVDTFDEETGIKIAKSRIKKGEDCGILETNSVTMLTPDQVMAILMNKLKWICDHIDYYITSNELANPATDNYSEDKCDNDKDSTDEQQPSETYNLFQTLVEEFRQNQTKTTKSEAVEDGNATCLKSCKTEEDIDDFIFGY